MSDRHAGRLWRTLPICTTTVLAITALLTVLQFRIPGVVLVATIGVCPERLREFTHRLPGD
jgi:hypothetical protein